MSGTATFSTAGSSGSRWPAWNTNPKSWRRSTLRSRSDIRARSRPRHVTDPPLAVRIPASTCSSVVLPDPDGPMIATLSPGATVRVTPPSGATSPGPSGP